MRNNEFDNVLNLTNNRKCIVDHGFLSPIMVSNDFYAFWGKKRAVTRNLKQKLAQFLDKLILN